jgi:hypothetical protein
MGDYTHDLHVYHLCVEELDSRLIPKKQIKKKTHLHSWTHFAQGFCITQSRQQKFKSRVQIWHFNFLNTFKLYTLNRVEINGVGEKKKKIGFLNFVL